MHLSLRGRGTIPQPFHRQQDQNGEGDQKHGQGQNRRADLFTYAGPHLAGYRALLQSPEKQHHDDFVKRSGEGEQAA